MGNDATTPVDTMMLLVNKAVVAVTDKAHWKNLPPGTLPETVMQIVWTAKDLGLDVQYVDADTAEDSPCRLVREGHTHALRLRCGVRADKRHQARLYWSMHLSIAEYLVDTLPSIADVLRQSPCPKRDRELFFDTFRMMGAA